MASEVVHIACCDGSLALDPSKHTPVLSMKATGVEECAMKQPDLVWETVFERCYLGQRMISVLSVHSIVLSKHEVLGQAQDKRQDIATSRTHVEGCLQVQDDLSYLQ